MMTNGWMDMTGFGPTHWLIFAVMVAVILYPIGRILSRVGFSPFWSVLAMIPFINLIALWVLAFADWPGRSRGS
jgi:predicted PurR-regulated permease PerM